MAYMLYMSYNNKVRDFQNLKQTIPLPLQLLGNDTAEFLPY